MAEKKDGGYEAFTKKFDKHYHEAVHSAQQLKFAHSRAHEAAEATIKGDYQKLVDDENTQDKYMTTFRNALKKEISERFKNKIGGLNYKKDGMMMDQIFESLGVPKLSFIQPNLPDPSPLVTV